MDKLKSLYKEWAGGEATRVEILPQEGSNRQYVRLYAADGSRAIGVIGQSIEENRAFIYLTKHFTLQKLPVPTLLAVSADEMRYLQTDLGSISLYQALKRGREASGRYNNEEKELLHKTLQRLPEIQTRGACGLDFTRCYPQVAFDKTSALFDLNYFKYCFLKATALDFDELKLEESFQLFATDLLSNLTDKTFLYRDFQTRNVMLSKEGAPFFIDYQSGKRGALQYDVASFLYQSSALFSPELREELLQTYLASLKQYIDVREDEFRRRLPLFVLFRLLQVLGAYGFRGYFERKAYFIKSVPAAIANLRDWLLNNDCPYPYLSDVLSRLVNLPQFAVSPPVEKDAKITFSTYDNAGKLIVKVFSFSYHKGIPEDESGNGGGYVFDCRGMHNPGRYEPYKHLTGLDEPVIRFLEDDGEILSFLEHIYALADKHVARYMARGFTNLMFAFGCTGGQHRSVYAAQHLAEYLHKKYDLNVVITHREQNITSILPV